MKTIEERAKEYSECGLKRSLSDAYAQGARDQKDIDDAETTLLIEDVIHYLEVSFPDLYEASHDAIVEDVMDYLKDRDKSV